jgi:Ca2+/H+ antiporter
MIDWIKDVAAWWTTGLLGMLLYWLPLAFCLVGYTLRCWQDVRHDLQKRQEAEEKQKLAYYQPSITVGTILGRAVVSVVPVANITAGVFDLAPRLFGDFFNWLGRVFDFPLVGKRSTLND